MRQIDFATKLEVGCKVRVASLITGNLFPYKLEVVGLTPMRIVVRSFTVERMLQEEWEFSRITGKAVDTPMQLLEDTPDLLALDVDSEIVPF
jgi:hypothetical protein